MIGKEAALALREITGPLMVIADSGILVHVDEALTRLLNRAATELQGRLLCDIANDNDERLTLLLQQFSGSSDWTVGILNLRGTDSALIEFPCQGKLLQRPHDGKHKLLVIRHHEHSEFIALNRRIHNIQTEMHRQYETELQLHLASFALDHASDAMYWLTPEGRIKWCNKQAYLGYSREELIGSPISLIDPEANTDHLTQHWQNLQQSGSISFERLYHCKDGHQFPAEVVATHLCFEGHEFIFTVVRDISERKKAEQTINELAFFDRLTGLPNRTLLLDRLKQAMTTAHRNGSSGAALLIDLDNFKTLNDAHGHEIGDLLLKQVAARLAACVREGDSIARFGGDEFIAIITDLDATPGEAATNSESVAQKILDSLTQPYTLGEMTHHTTASIGVTLFHGERVSIDDLLKQAELAMYKAKGAGRNTIRFFDLTLESTVQERASLEHGLRRALNEQQYLLHYQPQIMHGRVTGAEALVRWQHPQRGMISPVQFIPLLEETGLILPLGVWVIQAACEKLAEWARHPDARLADLTVAVNVSARQFRQPDFVAQVLGIIEKTGANPEQLKLELTESLLVQNIDEVIEKMFALKKRGVGFSLDDFGTGYSSLAYLKQLPLDQLKIDQSFVRDVLSDANDASIARTIIALAQNLGMSVIAEGVETEAQQKFLADSGCHAYQGYLFSKPLPAEAFEAFARQF